MHGKQVRVIKRGQISQAPAQPETPAMQSAPAAERELKEVVSGWVRDHQRRSEEFRQNYSTLLGNLGFKSPAAGRFALASALQK